MRYISLSILCILIVQSSYSFDSQHAFITPFTHEVYYRYYLIKRCEEPVRFLIKDQRIWNTINFDLLTSCYFETTTFKNVIDNLKKTRDKKLFIQLWDQLKNHRHIENPLFEHDFITLIFHFYKSLHPILYEKKERFCFLDSSFSQEMMLTFLDESTDNFNKNSGTCARSLKPIENDVSVDDITFTYYLIQRLKKPLDTLFKIEKKYSHPALQKKKIISIDIDDLEKEICFSHERIKACCSLLFSTKNLRPLFQLWQEFSHFRYTGDNHFTQEMLMMVFTLYRDILLTELQEKPEHIILNETDTILEFSDHIHELSPETLLTAIELTSDKLILLNNNKTKDNKYTPLCHTLLALTLACIIVKQSIL